MNVLECLRVALRGLANNKMRTALTMLGMIIGVAVVIVVVAIGEGATQSVTDAVNYLGANLLHVTPNRNRLRIGIAVSRTSVTSTAASTAPTPVNSLTLQDAEQIVHNFPTTIDTIAPQIDSDLQIRLDNDDFRIRNQSDLMQTQQSVTGTMTTLLSCVAVISLIDSAIISLLGGLIGIGTGVGGALLLATVGGWHTIINSKAAALHPINALRFE